MEKKYTTSIELTAHERLALLGILGFLFICWLIAFCDMFQNALLWHSEYYKLATNITVTMAFFAIVRVLLSRELRETTYQLTNTHIVKKSLSSIDSVRFGYIKQFFFHRTLLGKKKGIITCPDSTLWISGRTRNLSALITGMQAHLIEHDNTKAFSKENLLLYKQNVVCRSMQNYRQKRMFVPALVIMLLFLTLVMATCLHLWKFPLVLTFLFTHIALIYFVAAIMFSEKLLQFIMLRKLQKKLPLHRHVLDVQVYVLVCSIMLIAFCYTGIFCSTIFQ